MKFIINKNVLVSVLQKLLGPTTTKQNLPVLSSVLISCEKNNLKFTTTDLDTTIIAFQSATIEKEGVTVVPMKRFFSLMRELPSEDILVEKVRNNLLVRCGKIEFKINTLDPQDFPQIEEEKGASLIKLNPPELEAMIRLTSFCVGYEDVNYVLSGILFEVQENTIKTVSTDGKRLAFAKRQLPANQPEVKEKISFILPIRAVGELQKLIKDREEEIYMFVGEKKIGFDFKDALFAARPVEGEFPNYSQYIPGTGKNKLKVNRRDLLFSLKRAGVLSTPDYQGVKISLTKDNMTIYKSTPQLGEIKESLACNYQGANMDIGFNPNYLIDALKNLEDEEACIDFFGPEKPAVLRRENYTYLILPVKI